MSSSIDLLSEIYFTNLNLLSKSKEDHLFLFSINDYNFYFNLSLDHFQIINNQFKESNIEFTYDEFSKKIKQYILENIKEYNNVCETVIVPLEIFIPEEELFYLKLKYK